MEKKKGYRIYRIVKWLVCLFYPKIRVVGAENLPDEPAVIVGNHSQMNGPIAAELYFPRKRYTWCAAEMMDRKEMPAYAYRDFWSEKPKWCRWFYRLLAHLIAPLSEIVFTNADTVPVYRDRRVLTTFRQTAAHMKEEGADVVIFPEHLVPYNHILWDFQEGFTNIARLMTKKDGPGTAFVPMYLAPALKEMHLGKPVRYDPAAPGEEERERIRRYLMEEITNMAESLPEHRVVPYPNMPKKDYPLNLAGKSEK